MSKEKLPKTVFIVSYLEASEKGLELRTEAYFSKYRSKQRNKFLKSKVGTEGLKAVHDITPIQVMG